MTLAYGSPVDRLLTLGEARLGDWPDYVETFGLDAGHVPELIRMATDESLNASDGESSEVWAPLHAWRALGQLHAEPAVEPLSKMLAAAGSYGDWELDDLPIALGMIGPAAIPSLERIFDDDQLDVSNRSGAVRGLAAVAKHYPASRDAVVDVLVRRLERYESQDVELTTWLVDELTELQVTEAASLIEKAFAADRVDISLRGDWEDVQIDLGLLEERVTPRPDYMAKYRRQIDLAAGRPNASLEKSKAKAKKKRKDAKAARKRNRRK
ncbi:MAG: hypothetical protein WBC44_10420 [Planctomycetaceae bacterium]